MTHRADGARNVYRLHRDGFEGLRRWLDAFWDEALDSLAALAEDAE